MGEYKPTIIESQVLNWLEYFSSEVMNTTVISVLGKENNGLCREKIISLQAKYGIVYKELFPINVALLREIHLLLYCVILYLNNIRKGGLIFQSRIPVLWLFYRLFHNFPKLRLIYEARGSAIVEAKHLIDKGVVRAKSLLLIGIKERYSVCYSHSTICVSNVMKMYYLDKYKIRDQSQLVVIPGVADHRVFYVNDHARGLIRSTIGASDKRVFVYSGRLDKEWQQPKLLFKLFRSIIDADENTLIMVLSPDIDIAKEYFELSGIEERFYYLGYEQFDQLNSFLNAADYGVLLRQDLPINNQASPTKFAEYVLSGLGIIISEKVGDFSDFVKNEEIGVVVANDNLNAMRIVKLLDGVSFDRQKISNLGVSHLSKVSHLKTMEKALFG